MRRLLVDLSLPFAVAFVGLSSLLGQPSAFSDLGGEQDTLVGGVSADGRVLFGNTIVPEMLPVYIQRPLVWRQVDGQWAETVLPSDADVAMMPYAASADGAVIAGATGGFYNQVPLVWTFDGAAWQRANLPLPANHGAVTEFISADGSVITGAAVFDEGSVTVQNIAWAWRRTGGVWNGEMLPDGENGFYRNALSADGSTLGGARVQDVVNEDESVTTMVLPAVWRHDGESWHVFTLHAPSGETLNGQVAALSADGRTAVGEVKVGGAGTDQGWRAVVWTYSSDTDVWTAAFLPALGTGDSRVYSISSDGSRAVGEAQRKAASAPVAALWTRVGGVWGASPLGEAGKGFSRGMVISSDGRLAFRDQSLGRSLYHLASGRNLPLAVVIATLEQRPAGLETWKFSAGYANVNGLGHDVESNSYTLIGSAYANGKSRPFVISGYAPFLFGEITRVGDSVSGAELPDLGAGPYKVAGLPAGLVYDDATRTVSGRFSRVGLFTTTILNTANGRKRTVLTLVEPLPSTSVGSFQSLLMAGGEEAETYPVARLTLTANAGGGFTGTLESDDGTTYRLKGVFAPDPEAPAELSVFASYGSTEKGLIIPRKKGSVPATFRLRANLRADGRVIATLQAGDSGLYASSSEDGSLQTRYAGKRPENSAPWRGRYTASLGVATALPGDTRPLPAGAGFATITVGADGKLSATGRLADGQKFTGSVLPGVDNSYRLYFLSYGRSGCVVAGWLRFEERGGGLYHVPAEAGGDLYWMRAATPGAKLYPAGFGPAGLALRAEPWRKPGDATLFGVSAEAALPLTLTSEAFSNTGEDNRYDLPRSVSFLARGVRLVPEAGSGGAMKFSINRDTGVVSGSITLVEPVGGAKRSVGFSGVLLQAAPDEAGAPILQGYFLEAALKNAESQRTLSGLIAVSRPAE